MGVYGIGYQGSKSRIADDIISILPAGKRFVDLFGGGAAMSHAALVSGKYESVCDIPTRRKQYRAPIKNECYKLQNLEHLERLEHLEHLEHLEVKNMDYHDYEYQVGDVVYLDPPYEGVKQYDTGFNHTEFYKFVMTRPYQVWFSSYDGLNFPCVWKNEVQKLMGITKKGAEKAVECLYVNHE